STWGAGRATFATLPPTRGVFLGFCSSVIVARPVTLQEGCYRSPVGQVFNLTGQVENLTYGPPIVACTGGNMDFPRPPASRAFRAQGDAFVPIRAAEQVVHESVPWLWRRRRVLGKLVMLDG